MTFSTIDDELTSDGGPLVWEHNDEDGVLPRPRPYDLVGKSYRGTTRFNPYGLVGKTILLAPDEEGMRQRALLIRANVDEDFNCKYDIKIGQQ